MCGEKKDFNLKRLWTFYSNYFIFKCLKKIQNISGIVMKLELLLMLMWALLTAKVKRTLLADVALYWLK